MAGAGVTVHPAVKAQQEAREASPKPLQPAERARAAESLRAMLGIYSLGGGTRGSTRRRGPGWTNRHAQRVAAKKRAVRAHRARSRA